MGNIVSVICIVAWFTSVFHCFEHHDMVMLILDFIFLPIGVLHGIYLWF